MTSSKYMTSFGFTEDEVFAALDDAGLGAQKQKVKKWYDVMIKPFDKTKKAFIFEFKVLDPDDDEKTLEDTLASAHAQIEEKQYAAELISEGFAPEQIRKYGFAFQGKECLIG